MKYLPAIATIIALTACYDEPQGPVPIICAEYRQVVIRPNNEMFHLAPGFARDESLLRDTGCSVITGPTEKQKRTIDLLLSQKEADN